MYRITTTTVDGRSWTDEIEDKEEAIECVRQSVWMESRIHTGLVRRMAERAVRTGIFKGNEVTITVSEQS